MLSDDDSAPRDRFMSDEDSNSELYLISDFKVQSIGGDVKMITRNVRLYKDEDFAQVVEIAVGPLRQNREDAEGVIRWASRSDSAEVFVAEVEGEVAGFLTLEWPGTWWNRVAEIGWIAVLPNYQRKGFGSALMKEMERYAEDKGIRKVYVEPSAENEVAIHFYIKNGYKPEAMRRDWYRDGEDSVILGKHLLRV